MTDSKHRYAIEKDRMLREEFFRIDDDVENTSLFFRGVVFAASLSVPFWAVVAFWLI
ncbi:hypothetical protein [Sphingomonas sp. PB1R3]|uniref:hypothetical protein n=1 Tax=Sphingomonas flavida TaxID=3096154 RepID=UPI002FC97BF9